MKPTKAFSPPTPKDQFECLNDPPPREAYKPAPLSPLAEQLRASETVHVTLPPPPTLSKSQPSSSTLSTGQAVLYILGAAALGLSAFNVAPLVHIDMTALGLLLVVLGYLWERL
jgi:hypothetical protein